MSQQQVALYEFLRTCGTGANGAHAPSADQDLLKRVFSQTVHKQKEQAHAYFESRTIETSNEPTTRPAARSGRSLLKTMANETDRRPNPVGLNLLVRETFVSKGESVHKLAVQGSPCSLHPELNRCLMSRTPENPHIIDKKGQKKRKNLSQQ